MTVPRPNPPGTITRAVNAIAGGAVPTDAEPAVRKIYDELRRLAAARLAKESGATLQPTDLVGEAFVKLFRPPPAQVEWESRRHFYGAAARAMQQVLIDHWRKRKPEENGGLDNHADLTPDPVRLSEALELLAASDASLAEIVRLRVFAGLNVEQTAETLELSERTVKRRFMFARLWLYRRLNGEDPPDGEEL